MSERPKILCLGSSHGRKVDVRAHFGDEFDVIETESGLRVLAQLTRETVAGVFVDSECFSDAIQFGRYLQSEKILEGMPDGVVLLGSEKEVLWSNGRLCEWTGRDSIVGMNFYKALCDPEIVGPDLSPLSSALSNCEPRSSVLRRQDNRYFQIHAAPVVEGDCLPEHLIVTVRDVTEQMLQQQQLDAIHRAGIELADLTSDEVANMSVEERIELLKSNILHYTKDLLHFNVVEIRILDQQTGRLELLLADGIQLEAANRELFAKKAGSGITGFVAATGKSYLCEQASEDPLFVEGVEGACSSLTVPLIFHDEVIGTFNVESPEPSAFSESDVQFLEIFSRDVAVAINTLDILETQQVVAVVEQVEAIHRAIAQPVDDILNDAVHVMEQFMVHESSVVERLQKILRNARDIKQVIHQVGQSMVPSKAKPMALRASERPRLIGKRILVVDDDESVRKMAHAILEPYGCLIETAHDGNEAVFMVRNLGHGINYDVIIADIRLSDMNGYDLMVKLKAITAHVPFVLMAGFGWDPEHTIVKARREGLRYVLYKPPHELPRSGQLLPAIEGMIFPEETEDGCSK